MPWIETSRTGVVSRLEREGWIREHGGKHDESTRSDRTYTIVVPRRRALAMPTARSNAETAGWV